MDPVASPEAARALARDDPRASGPAVGGRPLSPEQAGAGYAAPLTIERRPLRKPGRLRPTLLPPGGSVRHVPATVEEIAYDAAARAIDRQYDSLGNLRTRAGTLLAAAALVASFVGPQAMRSNAGSISGWVAIGIVALVAVLVLVVAILWPRRFVFRLSATTILEDHAVESTSATELMAFLAESYDRHHDLNEKVLDQLRLFSRLASVAVVVETIALIVAV